jgi:hypothetical protein
MTQTEALKLALEAYIKAGIGNSTDFVLQGKAHDLAVEALAQPEQEPDSESVDALRTLSYCDGLKAGWNFCVADDHDGFERAQAATSEAVRILKAQPKQPEQEPVAWRVRWPKVGGGHTWVMNDAPLMAEHGFVNEPLYTTPPQRTWVGLTDEEKISVWDRAEKRQAYQGVPALMALIQEVESKLKEKNT